MSSVKHDNFHPGFILPAIFFPPPSVRYPSNAFCFRGFFVFSVPCNAFRYSRFVSSRLQHLLQDKAVRLSFFPLGTPSTPFIRKGESPRHVLPPPLAVFFFFLQISSPGLLSFGFILGPSRNCFGYRTQIFFSHLFRLRDERLFAECSTPLPGF